MAYESATGAFTLKAVGKPSDPPTQVYCPPQATAFVSAAGEIRSSQLTTNPAGAGSSTSSRPGALFSLRGGEPS